eukprot:645621-Ditylum_brightwellii.AAC.1
MESGCEGVKGTFGVDNSLIILHEVCTELVADIVDIVCPSGGGDCAGVSRDNALFALDVDEIVEPDNGEVSDDVEFDDIND